MNEAEIAWCAGLLEGEGTFSITKQGSITVSCNMTDLDVLEKLQEILGGRLTGPYPKEKGKPYWNWHISIRAEVVNAIRVLAPWMCERRSEKIGAMLDWNEEHPVAWAHVTGGKHGGKGNYQKGCRCDLCVEGQYQRDQDRYWSNPEKWRQKSRDYMARKNLLDKGIENMEDVGSATDEEEIA